MPDPLKIEVTPGMIAAGVNALAFAPNLNAEALVELIYRAMAGAAALERSGLISGLPK